MEQIKPIDRKTKLWLLLLMLTGLLMRLWHIDYQSLWVDELYTIQETAPDLSWADLFNYLKEIDTHPPLIYVIVKIFIYLFGHTALVLRLPSAIAGTLGIWAIFMLGREMWNNRMGLIAATITTVNYFSLYYSQEGRDYIFTFLMTTLSFLYLIRLLKNLSLKNSIGYGVFTLLLLYSHYFSFFLVFAQSIIVLVFFIDTDKKDKAIYIKRFLLSVLIVIIGYLPWISHLAYLNSIHSFWIQRPANSFLADHFMEYFGNSELLKPLLVALLLYYIFKVFSQTSEQDKKLIDRPLTGGFIIMSIWITGTYLIPYVRSLLVVPMLIPRYTVVVLPAYIMAISIGIECIVSIPVKRLVVTLFLILSAVDIIVVKKYYTTPTKAQFREMTGFIVERNKEGYPILEEMYAWLHAYYFKKAHVEPHWITIAKSSALEDIMKQVNTPEALQGFWMSGGHNEVRVTDDARKVLNGTYYQAVNKNYWEAWAELYLLKVNDSNTRFITCADVSPEVAFPYDSTIAVYSNNPATIAKLNLKKGRYDITVSAKSTAMNDTFANIRLLLDDQSVFEFQTGFDLDIYKKTIEIADTKEVILKAALINDGNDKVYHKDRNGFFNFIMIKRIGD